MKNASSKRQKRNNKNKTHDANDRIRRTLVFDPPPIWFTPKAKKGAEGTNKNNEENKTYKEIESYFDINNKPLGKFKVRIRVLRDPTPEDWLLWLQEVDDFYMSKPNLAPREKALIVPQFLSDTAKLIWQKHYLSAVARVDTENKLPENVTAAQEREHESQCNVKIYEYTMMACTREFLHKEQPAISEKNYLRRNLVMMGYTIRNFVTRLKQINEYFPYFPPRYPGGPKIEKLSEDELVSIIMQAIPTEMHVMTLQSNVDPLQLPFDNLIDYLERLQNVCKYHNRLIDTNKTGTSKKRKANDDDDKSDKKPAAKKKQSSKYCEHCKMSNHNTSDCWSKDKKKSTNGKKNFSTANANKQQTFTTEQVTALFANLPSHLESRGTAPRKKRKILVDSSSDEESNGNGENPNTYFMNRSTYNDRSSTNK